MADTRRYDELRYQPQLQREGTALCLSGGGFRAAIYHLGALRRLNELGVLSRIDTFTSVSGGSIVGGVLGQRWEQLTFLEGVATNFEEVVAAPLRAFVQTDLRTEMFMDRFAPGNWLALAGPTKSITDLLAEDYADRLSLGVPLASLPEHPRFVYCATNLESGEGWQFGHNTQTGKVEMGDRRMGWIAAADFELARAVAASSAFPMLFPPLVLSDLDPKSFRRGDVDIPLVARRSVPLGDGGIYDNMGVEPVWNDHRTVLVSDAGAPFHYEDDPRVNVFERMSRSYHVVAHQAADVRKRWLLNGFQKGLLRGTYWGIASDVAHYELDGAPGYSGAALEELADVRTDLDAFSYPEVAALENHGYALANVAVLRWMSDWIDAPAPFRWPHPEYADDAAVAEKLSESDDHGTAGDLWHWATSHMRKALG